MKRGYKKKLIIFSVIAVVLLIVGSFYLNFQLSLKTNYLALKNGVEADVISIEPLSPTAQYSKYIYIFDYNGEKFTSTTIHSYTSSQINSKAMSPNGSLKIRFLLDNGKVVLSASEKSKLNNLSIANSCEDYYFALSKTPSLTASIAIFVFCAVFVALAILNYLRINAINTIQREGNFTYAVFIEAQPSPLGSNRYMAVKYSYQNQDGDWVENTSPYAYTPNNVELLKNLQAISIKYKNNRSVIVETLSLKR